MCTSNFNMVHLLKLYFTYNNVAYLELCLKSCLPSFLVLLFQFLNGTRESRGWDLSVSTGERLQDCIMDEHILVLGGSEGEGGCSTDT